MKIYGITGGIASGKTTVSGIMRDLGIDVIDADDLAKKAVEPGSEAFESIVKTFGEEVVDVDGTLNRKRLGDMVFGDEVAIERLNKIVHPQVNKMYDKLVDQYKTNGSQMVVYDCPLLIEENLIDLVDEVILVIADRQTQIKRLMARNDLEYSEAIKRINSQMEADKKIAYSDYIIYNDGDFVQLRDSVVHLWEQFLQ